MRTALAILTAAVALAAARADGPTRAEPPEAAFEVADGWLHVRVTDAGRPLPGVSVRCLVGPTVWAAGETDAAGRGAFPRPPGDWCQLVFDLGAGPSAPVPLTFLRDGTAVPLSAPVRDGTAACCVLPVGLPRQASDADDPAVSARQLTVGLGVGVIAYGLALAVWRQQSARPTVRRPARQPKNSRRHRK